MKSITSGSQLGMIGGAVLATACCWVPLTLGGLGLAVTGMGALDAARPLFLGLTFVLMGWCFFEAFVRRAPEQESCDTGCADSDAACGARQKTARRIFVAHAVLVAVVLLLPAWPGLHRPALAGSAGDAVVAEADALEHVTASLEITGMTCMGCVRSVEALLAEIEGMQRVVVTLRPGRADIAFDAEQTSVQAVIAHLAAAGYGAVVVDAAPAESSPPTP